MTPPVSADLVAAIQERVAAQKDEIITFFRELCAIPSVAGQIGPVGERMAAEMRRLGFEDVRFDPMGNIMGRIGHGPRTFVYDTHIDTVGIADPQAWQWDPFEGKIEDGYLYARGAGDEKGSAPGMVYGLAIAHDLGLLGGYTAYVFGNMEEDCDGIAPNTFVEVDPGIRPDFAVIGEPTRLKTYRGHKGRVELKVVAKGRSAHAASNQLGDNAVYKMLPVIAAIRDLEPQLGDHPFLGHGKITVSDIKAQTASLNAVPDECTVYIDRRLTFGETMEEAIEQVRRLIPPANQAAGDITVEMLYYDIPSYTGFVFPVDKYYPAWALEPDHPLVRASQATRQAVGLPEADPGKWDFSTNGTYWTGKAGIPSIGFGPGEEEVAHTVMDRNSLAEVVKATEFYALFPALVAQAD
jgi:putative selenium metabolism hydrolase